MKSQKKRGQFNFTWIFALFAGAAILILAINGATRGVSNSEYQSNTQIAQKISILIDPLQAGYSDGSISSIHFNSETRIRNNCIDFEFGRQKLSVSTRQSLKEDWTASGEEISVNNKYIFSETNAIGEDFYVFSKPFYFPYKTADLVILISQDYCLNNTPNEIFEEIENLENKTSVKFEECTSEDIVVCFDEKDSSCDIIVNPGCSSPNCKTEYDTGTVVKGKDTLYYTGNLMYAAIFSEESVYDCNVERLLYRSKQLAKELSIKIDIMNTRDCKNGLDGEMSIWLDKINETTSETINSLSLYEFANSLEEKNDVEACNAW